MTGTATGAALVAWTGLDDEDAFETARQNTARIITLQRGMTPERVIEHIGLSGYEERIHNPFSSEMYPAGDDTFRVLFFYSQTQASGSFTAGNELIPIVFKNGSLDSWAWTYWENTAAKYNILIRNR